METEQPKLEAESPKVDLLRLPELRQFEDEIRHETVLIKAREGELSLEQWREFAVQRYRAAQSFDGLVGEAGQVANDAGMPHLADELNDNLADELGIPESARTRDEQGIREVNPELADPDLAHGTWRKQFYGTLGLDEAALEQAEMLAGTTAYQEAVGHLLQSPSPRKLAGAVLALERTIPHEFGMMLTGLAKQFSDQFAMRGEAGDPRTTASRYLRDHIDHDAIAHTLHLVAALQPYVQTEADIADVSEGIRVIREAKRAFYGSLQEQLAV